MDIETVVSRFSACRVMVLGDIMLDHYVCGCVERISPEAPVPVLDVQSEEYRLGGAANVALNIRSLGAEVILAGVCGADERGEMLRKLLTQAGISGDAIVRDASRVSTLKTRISAVNQQIVRLDYENRHPISFEIEERILEKLETLLPSCQGLIIEDYNKGLLTKRLIGQAINICAALSIPVAVDPKFDNFFEYRNVSIFKPNYSEMKRNLGIDPHNDAEFYAAAQGLRHDLLPQHLVITRGAKGMYVFSDDGEPSHLPTAAREVFDVSGAGDTVISALTLAHICGAPILMAAEIANHAAGVVCGKNGTATVSAAEILGSYHDR